MKPIFITDDKMNKMNNRNSYHAEFNFQNYMPLINSNCKRWNCSKIENQEGKLCINKTTCNIYNLI